MSPAAPQRPSASGPPTIAPGAHIVVRDAVWRVVQVDRTSSGRAAWRVVGVDEIVRDQDAIFLEEYETTLGNGVRVLDPTETELELDRSPGHRASLLYLESLLRQVPPAGPEIHVGHRAAMDVLDFQLEPAHQALSQTRPRILIADAVGLGKTLEAGILLSELIRRGRAKRILVTTTKAMLTQFQKELWSRFAIPLVRLDTAGVQRVRDRIPTNHNPFYFYDRSIISIDTLAQNKEIRSYVERARWDVIVIDEAHNVAFRGGSRSLRSRIAQQLSERSDALILLSATPHDGKPRSFASLMNMLDPTAIANPDRYSREDIEGLFVRRFKKDVQDQVAKDFPERRIRKLWAEASPTEEAAFAYLADLSFTCIDADRRGGGMLFKTSIEKALFSSPAACRETIRKRITKRADDPAMADDIAALEELDELVGAIAPEGFSKYQRMLKLIRDKKDGFGWKPTTKDDRLVLFSESIETLKFLEQQIQTDLGLEPEQVALLHGGSDLDQQAIVEEFGKLKSKVRVLLASDVASEGLNLHYLSHRLIHFDVPWSLMRFAQRNGRIDRYGQERRPEIYYLLTQSTTEKIHGDARILELLAERDEQATKNIGDPSALMGVYDEDAEEEITGRAIEEGLSPEEFDERLGSGELRGASAKRKPAADHETPLAGDDPMELLLSGGTAEPDRPQAPTAEALSLFPNPFAFVETALAWLADQEGVQCRVRRDDRVIELTLPAAGEATHGTHAPASDLRRRFHKLPSEVLPNDGVVVLTDDRDSMQEEMAAARREESAWPRLHFLWPLSPVTEWCADRARALFGRQTAPVLTLIEGLEADEAVVIVSGLLPNRQSQSLVHRWFAVRFRAGKLEELEDFAALARRLGLGSKELPSREPTADLEALRKLVAPAIEATRTAMLEERAHFEHDINERLQDELDRLEALRARKLAHLTSLRESSPARRQQHDREERAVHRVFDEYLRWVEDAMTSEPAPYLEVVAVLRPEAAAPAGAS